MNLSDLNIFITNEKSKGNLESIMFPSHKEEIMKTKAFSLIEVIIAVAIIAVLSSIVTPQVRVQLAKGKDTKAIAFLHSLRVASQMYQMEHSEKLIAEAEYDNSEKIKVSFEKLREYLDPNAETILKSANIEIGGSRAIATGDIKYGGKIGFTFKNPDTSGKSDGVYIWFKKGDDVEPFDSRGTSWTSY